MDLITGYERTCPLCRLVQDGEILTRVHYEDDQLIVVDCLVCRVPMAVLRAHRDNFEQEDQQHIRRLFRQMLDNLGNVDEEDDSLDFLTIDELRLIKLLPDWSYQGMVKWIIDWEQRQIPHHPHCHLRPFPFPNTSKWEALL